MTFSAQIKLGNHLITASSGVFIIGEAGVNHNGNIAMAKQLVDVAVEAGVDAVKFQAFRTESLILEQIEKAPYQKANTEAQESQAAMLKKLELSRSHYSELKSYCDEKGIIMLITPFDETSLDELDELGLAAYKVASTDTTNLPFLRKIAAKGKPILLSTGMCFMDEVEAAMSEIAPINTDVILLQCTANYPIENKEVNLRVMNSYKEKFGVLTGYSDHSVGIGASPYAVAAGAVVVEKHFTLDQSLAGPDHLASLNPAELKTLVTAIKRVSEFMGEAEKKPTPSEMGTKKSLQKNLVAAKFIEKGEVFSMENMVAKRTGGTGTSPIHYKTFLGRPASRSFEKNEVIYVE